MPVKKPIVLSATGGLEEIQPGDTLAVFLAPGVAIQSPTAAENVALVIKADRALTITQVVAEVAGSNPSVTWQLGVATTRGGALTNVFAVSQTTTGSADLTTFASAVIAAGSYLILTTSAVSGTINRFELNVKLSG